MSNISFLAVPNIEGMRLGWYIQLFGIVIVFGICLFFVIYFWIRYHRGKVILHQLITFDQQTQHLAKNLLVEKIRKSSGKVKLILFIEYLERFLTSKKYSTIGELLISHGFTSEEAEELTEVMYSDKLLSEDLETKITEMLNVKC